MDRCMDGWGGGLGAGGARAGGAALAVSRCWRGGRSGVRPLSGTEVAAGLGKKLLAEPGAAG